MPATPRQKVTGVGGIVFRAKDPDALNKWYEKHLGIDPYTTPWRTAEGVTVFNAMKADTDYFGRMDQQFMLNFRVADLDAMVVQLKADGVKFPKEPEAWEGMGKFAWVEDPEGNRIELWEPEADNK
jgi:glyoxylase I family protein